MSSRPSPLSSRLSEAHGEISGDPSTTLGMTREGLGMTKGKGGYYDEERDYKVHRSDHRVDRIGDTDCTGCYILYGVLRKGIPRVIKLEGFFYFTCSDTTLKSLITPTLSRNDWLVATSGRRIWLLICFLLKANVPLQCRKETTTTENKKV